MKKFTYKLEKVLEYRRQLELDRRRALSVAVDIFNRREKDLAGLNTDLASYREQLTGMGTGKIASRELALYRAYLTHLEIEVGKAAAWLRDAATDLETRRTELSKASREKKVLEEVKNHQRARHAYQANREETKELDEVGGMRALAARVAVTAGAREEDEGALENGGAIGTAGAVGAGMISEGMA